MSLLHALALAACALATSCTPQPADDTPITPREPAHSPEQVPEEIPRLVTIVPSATELVFALGQGETVVARSQFSDFPTEVSALPSVGSGLALDVERILSLQPTLIVGAQVQEDLAEVRSLRQAGVDVLLLPDASVADVQHAITTLGDRLEVVEQASLLGQQLQGDIQSVMQEAGQAPWVSTLIVTSADPIFAAGPESFVGELLPGIHATNVLSEGDWVQVDPERLLALAPEVIVMIGSESTSEDAWDRYTTVPAVANDRVCFVDPNLAGRPGPRLGQGLRAIYRCVHP